MKKQYKTPTIDLYTLAPTKDLYNTVVMNPKSGQAPGSAAKERYETDDEDTYNVTDESNYGTLW